MTTLKSLPEAATAAALKVLDDATDDDDTAEALRIIADEFSRRGLPIFSPGRRIARWQGVLFLAAYGAYSEALQKALEAEDKTDFETFRQWYLAEEHLHA